MTMTAPVLSPAQIACLLVVTAGAICDLRTKKIPNKLTFPAAGLGIVLQFISAGLPGALAACEGWLLAVGVMLATGFLGWKSCPFGMGDVKLLAAVGSLLGPSQLLLVFFWFFLSFATVAWWRLAAALPWRQFLQALPVMVTSRNLHLLSSLNWAAFHQARKSPLLFGPFCAAGTFCAIFFGQQTRAFLGFK